MNIWIIIVIILLLAVTFLAFLGNKETNQAGIDSAEILSRLETKYHDFIDRKMRNRIITHSNFDFNQEKITEETMILIKPEIDALISHVNATTYSSVKINYEAKCFSNIPMLTSELFAKSRKNPGNILTKDDEKEYYTAFKDAIKADLLKRVTELKDGEFN